MPRGPGFRDERGAAAPDPAHAESEKDAKDHELGERAGEAAEEREDRIDRDAQHQRARAAEAIRDPPERRAAGGRGDEHHR